MKKINLAVIFGGKSGEHEVSLSSARGVIAALDKEKYEVFCVAIDKKGRWIFGDDAERYLEIGSLHGVDSDEMKKFFKEASESGIGEFVDGMIGGEKIDLVLPVTHGPYGEDGRLQGMLEMIGVEYVFSGVLAHALAMNKAKAKIIVERYGVPVADSQVINKKFDFKKDIAEIAFPIVVKPVELGSSVGVTIAKNMDELKSGIETGFEYGKELILEDFLKGREFTVTVMGNENPEVLAVTEIIPKISEFYDYKAKYEKGGSEHICPAQIPEDVLREMKRHAVNAFKAIGCRDLARVDFIWDNESGKMIFIEINTIPGMTPTSLAPEAARVAGMNFTQFLDRIIEEAMNRD